MRRLLRPGWWAALASVLCEGCARARRAEEAVARRAKAGRSSFEVTESSGGGLWRLRERAQAGERVEERFAPGPAARQVEAQPAGVAGEPAGDVEEPVAQPLGLAAGELAVEQEPLRPGEQVLGRSGRARARRRSPRMRGRGGSRGRCLCRSGSGLRRRRGGGAAVRAARSAALLVGDEGLEAVAVVVGEGELRARVGPLAAADRPRPRRPAARGRGRARPPPPPRAARRPG